VYHWFTILPMPDTPITVPISQESRDALAKAAKDMRLSEDKVVEMAVDRWMAEIVKRCTKVSSIKKSGQNMSNLTQ